MDKVQVSGLRFHAYHGCHPDEKKVGGTFEVDVTLHLNFEGFDRPDEIQSTPDYTTVMEIASQEMTQPRKLIETVAASMAKRLKSAFDEVEEVEVMVRKISPPVSFELDSVSVTIKV